VWTPLVQMEKVLLLLSRAHRAYGRKGCTAGGEETGDKNEGTKAMGKACWLVSLCFRLFMLFPSARPCLALVFVMSLLRRHGCCCCGARWRLQLGEWLNLFLVAVGAGHGSAKVVLLAAGIFRGRPVWGFGVASLLLSGEGLAVASGFECFSGGAELRERWDEWRAVSWGFVDREWRPVSGVHSGCKLGEWGLAMREEKLVCRGKVWAEKGGGAVMAVVERESGASNLLVGREDHEFVFSWKGKVMCVVAGGEDCKPKKKKTIGERWRWLGFGREKKLDLSFFLWLP